MGISTIIAELQTAVDAFALDEYTAALPTPVVHKLGARFIASEWEGNRIVWFPVRENTSRGPPPGRGARTTAGHPITNRAVRIGLHLWGSSVDAAEALLECVVKAAHRTAIGSYDADTIEWALDEHQTTGEVVTLELTIHVPVVAKPAPTALVTAVQNDPSGAVSGDHALDTGEN